MAMSLSRPDPGSPAQVAEASFNTSRRGFDQNEVRDFLRMVAAEMARHSERIRFLEREVEAAQTSPEVSARLDEETLTRLLGEETARVLGAARASANEIREKAEQSAAQLVAEASDEATRIREQVEVEAARRRADAAADAEAELEMAKQQGREMVNEARAYRERVLSELSRRRELAREQIEQLVHGRDRLVEAFERARVAAVDVMAELEPLGEPSEYVNLTPTTGPVPVMVAADPAPAPPAPDAPAADEPVTADDGGDHAVDDAADVTAEVVELVTDRADDEVLDEGGSTDDTDDAAPTPGDVEIVDETSGDAGTTESDVEADDRTDVAAEADEAAETDEAAGVETTADGDVVVDLFARLRSETDTSDVALDDAVSDDRADTADPADPVDEVPEPVSATVGDTIVATDQADDPDLGADELLDDDPFARRDADLTPLIVASARKLKRVLADEQNEVLEALRRAPGTIAGLDALVPVRPEHAGRFVDAVSDDLLLGAHAGAAATDDESVVRLARKDARDCVDLAGEQLADRLVGPMRDRLERAVADTGGDPDALTKQVRALYREVKTRHIDDVLDDVFRTAHGAGVSASVPEGEPVAWTVDQRHPACPDCDDNALSAPVPHGEPFPTGHVAAPAHPGCRCMLQTRPR